MKLFGQILLACVALAILQAALAVVVIGVLLAVLIGLIRKPRETLAVFGLCLTVGLFQAHPLFAVSLILTILVLSRIKPRPIADADRTPLRLTHVPTVEPIDGRSPDDPA